MTYCLVAGGVATPLQILAPGWVLVAGPSIVAVGGGSPPAGHLLVDLGDRLLAPGFVDIHVHGGGGALVDGATAEEVHAAVRAIAAFHLRHGTTALLPTVPALPPGRTAAAVAGIRTAAEEPSGAGARVLGSHLEGPWLAPARTGAQNRAAVRSPDLAELSALLDAAAGSVRLLTIAPELPGAESLIEAAVAEGVTVGIGHSDADYETAVAAFAAGASHVTHLFNAMSGLGHRDPGVAGAALADDSVTVEVIADGVHVHPAVLRVAARSTAGRLVAVTDAVWPGQAAPGTEAFAGQAVIRSDDSVRLAADPSVLAGSTLTMDRAVRGLVHDAGLGLPQAIAAATAVPARVARAAGKGRLAAGLDADLVVLEPDFTVAATVLRGLPVQDPGGLIGAGLSSRSSQ